MHGVILAAGEGSRLGADGGNVPKAFIEVAGRTLYARQRRALAPVIDDLTVVLGYNHERAADCVGRANVVVVEDWAEFDNAESLRLALERIDDHVLVCNGDVVVSRTAVTDVAARHDERGRSVVACLPGTETEETAVRTEGGLVTDYGMMPGKRHAGLGIVDRRDVDTAARVLRRHRDDWYPIVYPELRARAVPIPPESHVEINRPEDVVAARERFPLVFSGERNAHS